eukprot:PhM_4_TR3310/c0_g1_i1/m.61044
MTEKMNHQHALTTPDIASSVLMFTSYKQMFACAEVCTSWNTVLVDDETRWRRLKQMVINRRQCSWCQREEATTTLETKLLLARKNEFTYDDHRPGLVEFLQEHELVSAARGVNSKRFVYRCICLLFLSFTFGISGLVTAPVLLIGDGFVLALLGAIPALLFFTLTFLALLSWSIRTALPHRLKTILRFSSSRWFLDCSYLTIPRVHLIKSLYKHEALITLPTIVYLVFLVACMIVWVSFVSGLCGEIYCLHHPTAAPGTTTPSDVCHDCPSFQYNKTASDAITDQMAVLGSYYYLYECDYNNNISQHRLFAILESSLQQYNINYSRAIKCYPNVWYPSSTSFCDIWRPQQDMRLTKIFQNVTYSPSPSTDWFYDLSIHDKLNSRLYGATVALAPLTLSIIITVLIGYVLFVSKGGPSSKTLSMGIYGVVVCCGVGFGTAWLVLLLGCWLSGFKNEFGGRCSDLLLSIPSAVIVSILFGMYVIIMIVAFFKFKKQLKK